MVRGPRGHRPIPREDPGDAAAPIPPLAAGGERRSGCRRLHAGDDDWLCIRGGSDHAALASRRTRVADDSLQLSAALPALRAPAPAVTGCRAAIPPRPT